MENSISSVSSWTPGTQNIIQAQSLFTNVLSNIVGYLDRKASEGQKSMAEEDPENTIILYSGSSIDIFSNTKLVKVIKRSNQVLHLSTNVGSKTNQMQVMVTDYGKVWYDYKAKSNVLSLPNLVNK